MDGAELKKLHDDIVAYIDQIMARAGLVDTVNKEPKYRITTKELNGKTLFHVTAHIRDLEDLTNLDVVHAWKNVEELLQGIFEESGLPIKFLHGGESTYKSMDQLGISFDD